MSSVRNFLVRFEVFCELSTALIVEQKLFVALNEQSLMFKASNLSFGLRYLRKLCHS